MDRFNLKSSPLCGHPVPPDWKRLDFTGKRRALISAGIARDIGEAARLLGGHSAAVRAARKAAAERQGRERHRQTRMIGGDDE
ncbi:MAG: hypothetical protein AAF236_00700 [Verrucomicrobiota bacterium]